ncbi:transmembrane protein 238 [Rhinatrema bivittatum]|uniref:transmembrane protein 238 n=1 Tax=Rhinatrema bivittatum TaxID=194408 RepID=UPI001125D86D|nr:transmembrane protein 238 [Rhinatrema bivittatum]
MTASPLARCRTALVFAVLMDLAGAASLLVGIFAQLQVNGRDFGDLLIYTGAILVFLSLIGWIFWYTGNIEISLEELERDYAVKGGTLARLARKISRRLSQGTLRMAVKRNKDGGSAKPSATATDSLRLAHVRLPQGEPPGPNPEA